MELFGRQQHRCRRVSSAELLIRPCTLDQGCQLLFLKTDQGEALVDRRDLLIVLLTDLTYYSSRYGSVGSDFELLVENVLDAVDCFGFSCCLTRFPVNVCLNCPPSNLLTTTITRYSPLHCRPSPHHHRFWHRSHLMHRNQQHPAPAPSDPPSRCAAGYP